MMDFRMPHITGRTVEEQNAQIRSFLYQHIEQLNWVIREQQRQIEELRTKVEEKTGG